MDFFSLQMRRFLYILFLLQSIQGFGQSFEAAVSNNEVRAGDVFFLEYRITGAGQFPLAVDTVDFFPAKLLSEDTLINNTNFTSIEIIDFKDSLITTKRDTIAIRSYQLIVWDSCALTLTGFNFLYRDSVIQFPPVFLNVSLYKFIEGIELMDIKEHFHEWKKTNKARESSGYFNVIVAVILLIMGLFIFLFFRRKLLRRRKGYFQITLQESTLGQIETLKREELWKSDLKEHFVRFSHILRTYLTGRYGVSFLDKTTEQSFIILDTLNLEESLSHKILELLKHSDLVKFAASSIDDRYIAILFNDITDVVDQTSPIIEEP